MNWRWNFLEKLRFDYEGELLNKRGRGSFYEDVCVEYLIKNGFDILHRNYRCKLGEIDIIAKKDDIIRFIEVKFRGSDSMALLWRLLILENSAGL